MRVINVSLNELETKVLMIGFEGENQITQVRIDAAEILTDHPNATPTLIAKPLFGFAYPVIVTKEGTDVVWEIDNSVLSFHGDGEIQLTFTEGTVIAKSYVGRIRIKRSLAVNGEAPDPIETWEQAATAKLAEVDAQIGELEDMVEAAEAAKDEAQDIVDDAAADIQAAGAAQVQVVQAKGTEVLNSIPADYSTLSGDVSGLKSAFTSSIDYLADEEIKRVYPVWEMGNIDGTTGEEVEATNSVRTADYIEKDKIALWNVQPHTGALYIVRYNYSDGVYTCLGYNQRTSSGNFTNWIKSLAGTHFRFINGQNNVNYPSTWMTLCYSTQIGKDIESLKATQTKTNTIESNLGYWRQYLEILADTSHPSTTDILTVDIKAGKAFMLKFTTNRAYGMQIYALYADGTNERILTITAADRPYNKSLYHFTANNNIIGISQYTGKAVDARTCITEVITEDSISNLIDYSKAGRTVPSIQMESECLYFETGRARYDVDTIHQSIAVWNNQVWEFGEGKAAYNGVVYELENGHGNNCNWGITLHGDYPYLYCPTWVNNETKINVFTFDGTVFTLDHVINLNLTGYMDAYVDEFSERIYAFTYTNNRTGVITFTIADLLGNVLSTKEISYRIPVIQGMCLHNGVLYVTSGFATQEFPNYLNLISTDGTLLARYPMYNIGEIEGIDFMDGEMILASYYAFYIHPTKLPNPFRTTGIFDQLEATT